MLRNDVFLCACRHNFHEGLCSAVDHIKDFRGNPMDVPCTCSHDARFLEEITEEDARRLSREGVEVFAHSFDPMEVDYFDRNGFQVWAKAGMRFEPVRFYKRKEVNP